MHDPDVVVFDIPVPIPVKGLFWNGRKDEPRWSLGRRRYSEQAVDPEYRGKPIRPWWRPDAWRPRVFGRTFRWWTPFTVWHTEPNGHDSGTICKGMRGSQLTWHNVKWAARHRRHLRVQARSYQRVRFWLLGRCADCGRRFRWKEPKFATGWDSKGTLHDSCHLIRHLRHQLEDAAKAVTFTATEPERFRFERWLQHREDEAAKAVDKAASE